MSAVLKQPGTGFRPMRDSDVPAVLDIEEQVYEFPWTAGIFRDCLQMTYCCWVYEEQGEVVAYGILSVAAGESHLLNLCVRPDRQGQGLGRKTLNHLVSLARRHQADIILLEVRPSNRVAIALYEQAGFSVVGRRRDYYPAENGREDALILARPI